MASARSSGGNLPTGGMNHHPFLAMSVVNYVVTQSEAIHINAGILRCIDLVLPEASVVNASFPAACGMRFTTAMRVHDLVLGALTRAMPGKVPVAGSGVLEAFLPLRPRLRERFCPLVFLNRRVADSLTVKCALFM